MRLGGRWIILGVTLMLVIALLIYWNNRSLLHVSAVEAASVSSPTAQDGKEIYEQNCMSCHASDGHGQPGKYPDLVSDKFRQTVGKSYERAYQFISQNMPENAPGSLKDDEYKAVVKYVLSLNGIPTDFSDIDEYWAKDEINALFDKKYVDGYVSDGKLYFKPDQNITRGEFIRYLVKAKEMFLSNDSDSDLKDISKSKDKLYIITAVDYGLIDGYEDHTFRPNKTITRAEIAAILARSEGLQPQPTSAFSDLPDSHWANGVIGAATQTHLFDGYEDGTFRPSNPITRGEAAAVIYRLLYPAD